MVEDYEQTERRRILQPKNDIVFQTLFGRGRITKAMLEDILGIEIQKIVLTEYCEFHIIEIPKVKEWMNSIKKEKKQY